MLNSDRPVIEVAKSLGINDSTLRHWVQNAKKDTGGAGGEESLSAAEKRIEELEITARAATAASRADHRLLEEATRA